MPRWIVLTTLQFQSTNTYQKKSCKSTDTKPSCCPASALGRARPCELLCPPAQITLNCWRTEACTRISQDISSTLQTPFTCTHASLLLIPELKTQHPGRKVQATWALQPCKLKQRDRSRRMLKQSYFLTGATLTNPLVSTEAITKTWASLKTKVWALHLGQTDFNGLGDPGKSIHKFHFLVECFTF